MLGRCQVRPLAESMNLISQLNPSLPSQRTTVGSESLTRHAGDLRDDKRVDVRIVLVIAPRPDMTQGAWQNEELVRFDLGREVVVGNGGLIGRGLDKHGKRRGGDLLQGGHGRSMWIGEGDSTFRCYGCQALGGGSQLLGSVAVALAFVPTKGHEFVKLSSAYF